MPNGGPVVPAPQHRRQGSTFDVVMRYDPQAALGMRQLLTSTRAWFLIGAEGLRRVPCSASTGRATGTISLGYRSPSAHPRLSTELV